MYEKDKYVYLRSKEGHFENIIESLLQILTSKTNPVWEIWTIILNSEHFQVQPRISYKITMFSMNKDSSSIDLMSCLAKKDVIPQALRHQVDFFP